MVQSSSEKAWLIFVYQIVSAKASLNIWNRKGLILIKLQLN